ncbi:hypothetical protein TPHA_0M00910 [Tetrapisispora phaffii CBS 4417]|uniref:Uncharacterized protein n=1 Tax=Tetrapisispora phaffii (strain ATCC 24235 / CBS 4417 / NBRC 1672 / NRRL Y-8282 / UCD 70-5) TaxID=1071381 RepID=G8C0F1_TETPH|nr:hypothetical protein TPHA_0M00910 [Tetrapisispora phaffii CBS 4417]CCE65666.1 hypothetical protein TPHA_0M00910 [Tetrapisispora phaffii CBS 4417]
MDFEVPVITVLDTNISHIIKNGGQHKAEETSLNLFKGHNHLNKALSFPTNIRYIFEDDDNELEINNLKGTIDELDIENIIVIDLDTDNSLQKVQLISDKYELLSYKEKSCNENSTNPKISEKEIELKVLSQFKEFEHIPEQYSLEDLIKLYAIQNEQIEELIDLN